MTSYDWDNYFLKVPLTEYTTRKIKYLEVRPIDVSINYPNNIISLDTGTIAYESFMHLKRSYVDIEVEILNGTDTKYKYNDNIALNNGCSLFNRVDLSVNGSSINNTNNKEPALNQLLLTLIKGLPEGEQSAQYSFFDTGYINQQGGTEYALLPTITTADNSKGEIDKALAKMTESINDLIMPNDHNLTGNIGQIKRLARIPLSKTGDDYFREAYHIRIPMHVLHPFCNQDKPIRGSRIRLDLHPEQKLGKILFGDVGTDAYNSNTKIVIKNISLQLAILQPALSAWPNLHNNISNGTEIPISYNNIQCLTYELSSDTIKLDIFSNAPRVSHVFIGFRSYERFSGSADTMVKRNKLMFDRFESLRGNIRLGENNIPSEGYYDTNRTSGWSELYENFLSSTYASVIDYDFPNGATNITFNQWRNVYPLVYFDCTKTDVTFANLSPDQRLTVDLEIGRTGTDLAASTNNPAGLYQMVVYVISDDYLILQEQNSSISIISYSPADF